MSKSGKNRLKEDAESIFQAGLGAVERERAVLSHLSLEGETLTAGNHDYSLRPGNRIFVVGAGKAGGPMSAAVERVLGGRITEGLVVVKDGYRHPTERVKLHEAGHPLPDQRGLEAAGALVKILEQAGEDDLVICLISGGGSALLPLPSPPLTLEDLEETTRALLNCGSNIEEINAVRKHLSLLKGGRLACLAYPARVISLILSDVPGDRLGTIASGPTVPDHSTCEDCLEIIRGYELEKVIPEAVFNFLRGIGSPYPPETPKGGEEAFRRTVNILVGNNRMAVEEAARKAGSLGYNTMILSTVMEGEAREVALAHSAVVREVLQSGHPLPPPACILSGGEPTVTIRGTGTGGRNQEFSLSAALDIGGLEGVVILSAGTDGTDGFTEAAGAFADGTTAARARKAGMDLRRRLDNNDSYPVFSTLGDLLITGPTKTNVMDIRVMLVREREKNGC